MMADQVENFIDGLIKKTRQNELEWQLFNACKDKYEILKEIENGRGKFDPGVNTIRESASYYIEVDSGKVFLFEIFHGDPKVTSPQYDTLSLMVKINDILPLDNIAMDNVQEDLMSLKLLIENQIEEKCCYPDVLYAFFNRVIG